MVCSGYSNSSNGSIWYNKKCEVAHYASTTHEKEAHTRLCDGLFYCKCHWGLDWLKVFQVHILIGLQDNYHSIWSHVRKSLLTTGNMDFDMDFFLGLNIYKYDIEIVLNIHMYHSIYIIFFNCFIIFFISLIVKRLWLWTKDPHNYTDRKDVTLTALSFAGRLRAAGAGVGLGGCFTNISRAVQNNLVKIYNTRNHIFRENVKLNLCTYAQDFGNIYKVSACNSL